MDTGKGDDPWKLLVDFYPFNGNKTHQILFQLSCPQGQKSSVVSLPIVVTKLNYFHFGTVCFRLLSVPVLYPYNVYKA